MYVLPDFSDAGNSIGRRVPEKSNFSQTCSLLSRYLKRNASFGDLNLGIASNSEIQGNNSEMFRQTRNLLPNMEISVSDPRQELNSIDLFPQQAGFTHHKAVSLKASSSDFRHVVEPETAQMTIFYGGQVLVLDKIAAERAKEVMLLACKSEQKKSVVRFVPPVATNLISACVNNSTQDGGPKLPPRPHVSGLPIARKASLHRFLEKRKDRLNAKSPYQLNNSVSSAAHTNPADSSKKAWLGLSSESSPRSLELQL